MYDYTSSHERVELEKINTLAQALKIIANNNECKENEIDRENEEVENKKIGLHQLVQEYFKCATHDEFLDLVQSHLPFYDHIRTQPVSKTNINHREIP